jgi:hypothetical protein
VDYKVNRDSKIELELSSIYYTCFTCDKWKEIYIITCEKRNIITILPVINGIYVFKEKY